MDPLDEVRRDPDKVMVVLRPLRRWSTVVVLAAVALAAILMIVLLVETKTFADVPLLALLGVFAITGESALRAAGWYLLGREVVTATAKSLTIEHYVIVRLGFFGRRGKRTYSATSMTNLRAVAARQVLRRGRLVRAAPALAFDHEGTTVLFGAGLSGATAERVVADLAGALTRSGHSALA